MRCWIRALAALAVLSGSLLSAGGAQAAWFKAETERFVVYGQGGEKQVRAYAQRLTAFDGILRLMTPGSVARPHVQKLAVYIVRGRRELKRISPTLPNSVGGFYRTTGEAVFAAAAEDPDYRDDILFHEYAHHFMLETFPAAYPSWFVEGWAEFFMTAEVLPGKVAVGGANIGRVYALQTASWLPLSDLLSKSVWEIPADKRGLYYSQAWLLMHYMYDDNGRAAQLNKASAAIAGGAEPVAAFTDALGFDLAELTRRLHRYTKIGVLTFKTEGAGPPVSVSTLAPSADDLLLEGLRLSIASPIKPDEAFLAEIRKRAASYPGDRYAELTLARAEFVHGDVAAGEAIVDRMLARDPKDVDVLRVAGIGQIHAGDRTPADRAERYRAGRRRIAQAFALEKNDFSILLAYVRCRTVEPDFPTDNDINVLLEARALAPSVEMTSMFAAQALLARGRRDQAMRVLAPLANNPHGGGAAKVARALMAGKSPSEAAAVGGGDGEDGP